MKHTATKSQQRGKDKGRINAPYFPKWYLCTKATPKRHQRQIRMNLGGKSS